ncbi:MAG: alpha/beta fold hydrolase [Ilumatobacteraceae bacterium]
MSAVAVNGMAIEYEVHGDSNAPPLLLVMGLGGQLVGWPLELIERLAGRGFRVIRFDNRDVGLSTKIDAPAPTPRQLTAALVARRYAHSTYLLRDMADDAAGLLDALGIEQAHVVGASMGGMISQTLAIHHPARVASLVAIMSNTGDRRRGRVSRSLLRKLPRLAKRASSVDDAVEMFRLISGPHFDAGASRSMIEEARRRSDDVAGTARQAMAIAASPDRTWELRRVQAPTLVVHGLADPLVLPSGGVATAKAIGDSRLLMFPDMGHDLPRLRWDEVFDAIVQNARRAEGGGCGQLARIA